MTDKDIGESLAAATPPRRKRAKRKARVDDRILAAVEALNRRHALVLVGDRALVIREYTDERGDPQVGFMAPATFALWHAGQKFFNGGHLPVGIGGIWLEHPRRRQYDGICFAPEGAPAEWYNTWRGFSVEPVAGEVAVACRTFLDHLRVNICGGSEAHFRWVLAWFAHMMQHPAERIGTSLVLRGGEGVGKTKIGEVFGSLIRRHYLLVDNPRYITGQFNAHLESCMLLQADEGFWAGDRQAEGVLKSLITSSRQMIERKGVDPVPMQNLVRLLVTSNEDWVVPVGLDGRRFAIFEVGAAAKQNKGYFAEIDREMDNGGRQVLLWHLLQLDISAVDLRQVPATGALVEQKIMSMKPEVAWWRERLLDGLPTPRHKAWPDVVPSRSAYDAYVLYCDRLGVRRKLTGEQFGLLLRKLIPSDGSDIRVRRKALFLDDQGNEIEERTWCYALPPLDECRAHFDVLMRNETAWEAPEG